MSSVVAWPPWTRSGERDRTVRRFGLLRRGGCRPLLRPRRRAQADHRQPPRITVDAAVRGKRGGEELALARRRRRAAPCAGGAQRRRAGFGGLRSRGLQHVAGELEG